MKLAERDPIPVRQMTETLGASEIDALAGDIPGWQVVRRHHLERRFEFKNYAQALKLANAASELAEAMDHHPDICFGWGFCQITIWTHRLDGLTVNDFILAARVDAGLG